MVLMGGVYWQKTRVVWLLNYREDGMSLKFFKYEYFAVYSELPDKLTRVVLRGLLKIVVKFFSGVYLRFSSFTMLQVFRKAKFACLDLFRIAIEVVCQFMVYEINM
ncbi:hypothetical protein K1719_010675 [Acacia pycnantha]|nr:hypothetical protein K1719_010675 [Acacia pycnantha]